MRRWVLRLLRFQVQLRTLLLLVAVAATALGIKLRWEIFQRCAAYYAALETATLHEANRMAYAARAAASWAEVCHEWDARFAARLRREGYTGPTYSGYDRKAAVWEAQAAEWARLAAGRRYEAAIYARISQSYLQRW